MIAFINGVLIEKSPTYAVVETHGVGYMLNISLQTYSDMVNVGEKCKLFTHLTIREDAHILYAFSKPKERTLFRLLITVSGIGTNTARMMLSAMSCEELSTAIANENSKLLQTIKGIGTKTAQRVVIDLKDKIEQEEIIIDKFSTTHNTNKEEALYALVSLGFLKSSSDIALNKIIKSGGGNLSVEELIKHALKIL